MRKDEYLRSDLASLPSRAQLGLFHLPRRREFLLAHAGAPPKDILDVGCASGYIGHMLTVAGHRVTGVELNAQMATRARTRGLSVLEHDLEEPFPLSDSSFDLVHACEIIEHLFDTEGFLSEVHRILRPGGTLILSTPNLNSLLNRLRVMVGRPLPMWGAFPGDRHGSHVRVFNKPKIVQLLDRTRFRSDVIWGVNLFRGSWLVDRAPSLSEMLLIKATRLDAEGHSSGRVELPA